MKKNNKKFVDYNDKMIRYGIKPPELTSIQLEEIKRVNEQFGVTVLSIEDLGEMELSPKTLEFINKNILRENKIITGEYRKEREEIYVKNYIDILTKAGISEDTIKRLKETINNIDKDILSKFGISSLLPPIKDFYITLKRGRDQKGRFISISDQADTMEEQINQALNDLEDLGYA